MEQSHDEANAKIRYTGGVHYYILLYISLLEEQQRLQQQAQRLAERAQWMAELKKHLDDLNTLVVSPTGFQVWGRKPG